MKEFIKTIKIALLLILFFIGLSQFQGINFFLMWTIPVFPEMYLEFSLQPQRFVKSKTKECTLSICHKCV